MSINNSLVVAASAVKDTVLTVADSSAVQGAVTVAADAIGKGGFQAKATIGQMLEFQLTGLLVVFVVLGGLTLMCTLMAWLLKTVAPDQYYGKPKAPPPALPRREAAPAAVPAAPASVHPGLSDEALVILLAAAASEEMGQAAVVVKFRPLDSMDWTWSVQGRVGIHNSHKLN
jgi:hypothetical protein